jgi:iron complex outermembrane receptor protein
VALSFNKVVLAGVLGASATPVCAQTLEEVAVTADRPDSYSADLVQAGNFRSGRQLDTPSTVNVVPNTLIESQQAQSLLDALRNVAGVSPSETSTTVYSNIAIRGITVDNRANYRLDGILPIVNLIDLPLEDKDRVEALQGAAALYYGFTTPAGIVNLTMKRATSDPYVAATVFGNEYGAVGGHIDAGDTWGPFGARVNALYGSVDSGIDATRGSRSLLSGAFDFKPLDNLALSLDLEHILKSVNEPGIYRYTRLPAPTPTNLYPALQLPPLLNPTTNFAPDWALDRAQENNLLSTLSWRIVPSWELKVSYGSSRLARDRNFSTLNLTTYGPNTNGNGVLSIGQQPDATNDSSNYRADLAGAASLWFMKHQLLLGASQNIRDSFTVNSVRVTCPGTTPTAPRITCFQNIFDPVAIPEPPAAARTGVLARVNDIGYYLFDRIEMADWLQVLGGVRKADYTETDLTTHTITYHDNPTSGSYGVLFKPSQWMSLYGSYIQGLESTPAAPLTAANAGTMLPATTSAQREGGIKIQPQQGLLIQAAYFDIDEGSAFVNSANVYVLDGRARFHGAEVSVTGEATSDWSWFATAQLLEAKQISGAPTLITTNPVTQAVTVVPTSVGRKIENTPRQTLSVASEYRLSSLLPGVSVNGAAYYISERAIDALNEAFIPGYTLFDVGAAYSHALSGSETTVRLSEQNVAGKRYFSSTGADYIAQGPPRMVKFAVTVRF